MKYKRYPKYKDSGVEWLGEVPAHWDAHPLKRGYGVKLGKMLQPIQQTPFDVLKPYLRASNIQPNGIDVSDVKEMWFSLSELDSLRLVYGDLLVSEGGDVGRAAIWRGELPEAYYQNSINRIRSRDGNSNDYLYHLLACIKEADAIDIICNRLSIAHLTAEKLNEIWILCPPYDEQGAIAAFLDDKITQIDQLIEKKTRFIELLKEKRAALITEAVTGKFDVRTGRPYAEYKDSGVEWLGEVPAHWRVVPIKRLSPVQRGASPRPIDDPKYFDNEGKFAWVRITDVSASDGVLTNTTQTLSRLGASLSVKVYPGQLFISIAGTVGKPCISGIKACIHDGFVYFPMLKVNPRFLYRIFETGMCYFGLGKMGTQLNLNTETVGGISIALPPTPNDIENILIYLDREIGNIDVLVEKTEQSVSLLKEKRAALITAVVTGKIDVRDFNPKR